ncbi:AAA family ATPase [Empedobacter falsenii]
MENKYQEQLFTIARTIDETNLISRNIYDLTRKIVLYDNVKATKEVFNSFQFLKDSNDITILHLAKEYNELLLKFYGFEKIQQIYKKQEENEVIQNNDEYSLEQLLDELNKLVGLEKVKEKVNDLIAFQKVQNLRKEFNLINPQSTLHIAFIGNPGTGKTTVARIIGRMYKQLGLLSSGHFLEVSRTDLIAGYQGQTALKVKKVIEKAKGGVLFIDEAYSITENEHSDSFGRECLTELTKALEDYRNDLVVIVAGYKEPMEVFFNSNPGLKSRFNTFIEFDDYNSNQLIDILLNLLKNNDYNLSELALKQLKILFEEKIKDNSNVSSNGRFVRNILDDIIIEHSKRVSKIEHPTIDVLKDITIEDLQNVFNKISTK